MRDLITDSKLDILCITETWLNAGDSVVVEEMIPETHTFIHEPREGRAGGVGVALAKFLTVTKTIVHKFMTFECLEVHLRNVNETLALSIIYRPPGYAGVNFIEEFGSLLMQAESANTRNIYVGDFNIWIEDQENVESLRFRETLTDFSIKNYVETPTHSLGHLLDLVLVRDSTNFVGAVSVETVCTISDHKIVSFKIKLGKRVKPIKKIKFRRLTSLSYENFNEVINNLNDKLTREGCPHVQNELKCIQHR